MLPVLPSASRMILTPPSSLGARKGTLEQCEWRGRDCGGGEGKVSESALKPPNPLFQAPRQVCPAFAGNLQRAKRHWGILLHETSVPSAHCDSWAAVSSAFHCCSSPCWPHAVKGDLPSLETSPWLQPIPPRSSHSPAKQLLPSWTNLR